MSKTVSWVFGVIFVIVGLLGFFMNPVLGIFAANTLHSLVHLVSGLLLLAVVLWWSNSSALVLKVLGVVYALVAILGFALGGDMILGLIDNTMADGALHSLLAVVFLVVGFTDNSSA